MVRMRDDMSIRCLNELVEHTGLNDIFMVEVGSFAGESAEAFASMDQVSRVWCVDPWEGGYDDSDIASSEDFSEVEKQFDRVMERSDGKIMKFKGTFGDFLSFHREFTFDIVYIDAMHSYESVMEDIKTAILFRPEFISGHDYNPEFWPGVVKAVDEMLGSPDRLFDDTSWIRRVGR